MVGVGRAQERPAVDPIALLTAKYRPRGRLAGGELLLRRRDAVCLIRDCRRWSVAILGMDFYVDTSAGLQETRSPADYSALFGLPDAVERSTDAAERLIGDHLPDGADWVSFVLADDAAEVSQGAEPQPRPAW